MLPQKPDPPLELAPPGAVDQPGGGVHLSWAAAAGPAGDGTPAGAGAVRSRLALLGGPEDQVLVLHPGALTRGELGVAGVV